VGNTIAENLKVKADKGWVKVALALKKADFDKLMASVKGMLGGLFKGKKRGAAKAAPPAKKKKAKKGK
jgi:hypothetical protein